MEAEVAAVELHDSAVLLKVKGQDWLKLDPG